MDEKNESTEEEVIEEETPEAELTEVTDWEAEAKKARGIAQRLRTKVTKLSEKKVVVAPVKEESKAGELNNADYALLSAKGIEEDDEITLIHQKMLKWDMPLREVLKDSDMQAKLKSMRIEREMKAATPSSTKRSAGGAIDNLDYWQSKYEHTGELPTDFALRSAVINARIEKDNTNKPAWH